MKIKFRDGRAVESENGQDRVLSALYKSALGRMALKPLTAPFLSRAAGKFLSTRMSCMFIKSFVKNNGIDMSQYEDRQFTSYNDFFARRIREGARRVDMDESHLISPADSKLSVCPITPDGCFTIKHTAYTAASLLQNEALAERFMGGTLLIFRLTVDDYHRFCYMADGVKEENVHIPGKFHTVNPIANDHLPIYKENVREYTVLHTQAFGDMVIMEVGALMVGKIKNLHGKCPVRRGDEKGYFEFGGSTIAVLLQKDAARIDEDILQNTQDGYETVVRMGERIGVRA